MFGNEYWDAMQGAMKDGDTSKMTLAELREWGLERVRTFHFKCEPKSRLTGIFAALTVEEAKGFARDIEPVPDHEIPIFEVFARDFATYDRNWGDYVSRPDDPDFHYRRYWYREITNHTGNPRTPPRLEVLIELPARVGRCVSFG